MSASRGHDFHPCAGSLPPRNPSTSYVTARVRKGLTLMLTLSTPSQPGEVIPAVTTQDERNEFRFRVVPHIAATKTPSGS